jgi:hypothetical protein
MRRAKAVFLLEVNKAHFVHTMGFEYTAAKVDSPASVSSGSNHTTQTRCLIPKFDGATLSQEWKEALWDKFVTGAARKRDRCGVIST